MQLGSINMDEMNNTVNVSVNTESATIVTDSNSLTLPAEVLTQIQGSVQEDVTIQSSTHMVQQARIIFARLVNYNVDTPVERVRLRTEFSDINPFKDEYCVLFNILTANYKIDIDEDFIRIYMFGNQYAVEHTDNIDLQRFVMGTENAYGAFTQRLCDLLAELKTLNVTAVEFETAIEKFKMLYLIDRSITYLETGVEILTDGKRVRGKQYSGYDGMRNYLTTSFNNLDKVREHKQTRGAVCYGVTSEQEEKANRRKELGKLGLPGIDDYYTVYEGEMINLLGAPKAGKSRACVQVINNMCVNNGVNCLIWSLENGFDGWEHMFRVKEFHRVYNKTVGSVVQKKILTESMLLKDTMTEEIRNLEEASWTSFKFNNEFGKLTNVEEALCYDNFFEILDSYVKKFNIKFICVDHLALMDPGKTGPKEITPLLADVYKKMKQYLITNRVAGIFPMHLKQELLGRYNEMSNAELADADLRDAASLSNEVIKTPDVNMAIVASKAQIAVGYERLVPILSRNVMFPLTEMSVDLGTSTFVKLTKGH